MRRYLPLVLLVAGCAAAPVAPPPDTVSRTPTATTTVATTSPRIDTPRRLIADPCGLLTAEDFDGPLRGTPQPHPDIPRSCAFHEGTSGEADLLVVVVFGDAYARPVSSMEMLIGDGHSAATSCGTGPEVVECRTLVAVNATESFKIIAQLRNSNLDQVASISQGYAKSAFKRLVTS